MWQRIQTLYLALSTILIGVLFFSAKAAKYGADGLPIEDLLALTTFKIRVFQMRTAILSALITLALQIWIAVDFLSTNDVMVFKITAIFPLISVVLDVLAAKGILADQMLVESTYHLRKARRERRK